MPLFSHYPKILQPSLHSLRSIFYQTPMAAHDVEQQQQQPQQPDDDDLCMSCKTKINPRENFMPCIFCEAPWHMDCLILTRQSLAYPDDYWFCPECDKRIKDDDEGIVIFSSMTMSKKEGASSSSHSPGENTMIAKILAIQADKSLTEEEKARKRQELVSGKAVETEEADGEKNKSKGKWKGKEKTRVEPEYQASEASDESFNCSICLNMLDRPVSTPCGHNFCLRCFKQSIRQGNRKCPLCRKQIPPAMANQPRINLALVFAIRSAKLSKSNGSGEGSSKVYEYVHNQDRPDKAFTTDRAKKSGKANASSGRIFVTVPTDHFGPILPEHDPERNRGVLVGDTWEDRLECRQWGAHFPPIKGIAGQKDHGAQSVILSGGYKDDEDHGEWFLYTGSGGRDLSGNKRTNKDQSFDQDFKSGNESLRLSCKNGYPVRVIRSYKDKHSSYAPEKGLRYDGIYRVEKCWRNVGVQGFKVCRYLFVRCDNHPAPWTSDVHGDHPRLLPVIEELERASNVAERKESPWWGFDEANGCWKWIKPPPMSKQKENHGDSNVRKVSKRIVKQRKSAAARKRLKKEFGCLICREVLVMPVTTPCGHNFCKSCLEGAYAGQSLVRERNVGGRALRSQRNVMNCPTCPTDLSDYLNNLQVNMELQNLIAKQIAEIKDSADKAPREKGTICAEEDLSGTKENHEENSDEADVDDGSPDPEMELKPEKPCKQRKVDVGEASQVTEEKPCNELKETNDDCLEK
ncbi:E3 ubiquitin-protein ligase ORTHRUS 2-like [Durio zibethinus]|uniref:RING-type E3 ubiquitin transferase n=1 Tax=Durio zibethinus TaxID=66656 RepID=A0A6P5YBE6_DURZI|nr:E3 ubiquitin-protein ligase ORTHRUS 2-like [Durio zibethinus]